MEELIERLMESKGGISIGGFKISVLVYCDDILLLTTSLSHLQIMLEICTDFGQNWKIKFNPKKCELVNAGHKLFEDNDIKVKMKGISLLLFYYVGISWEDY